MGEHTEISWTDATFNPWQSCTKVSPACTNCYAESIARRFGVAWGPGAPRRIASERTWDEPLKWNAKAIKVGVRKRVFCASMADVFDNEAPEGAREWLWELIEETTALDWLVLTKRVGNVQRMIPARWQNELPQNVWLGISVCDQEEFGRDVPKLRLIPAAIRFLSLEPLLAPISISPTLAAEPSVHWIIVGGESGPHARPFVLGWAKDIVHQCRVAGVAPFVKQLGARPVNRVGEPHKISDRKGSIMAEWPEELRVREWPKVARERAAA